MTRSLSKIICIWLSEDESYARYIRNYFQYFYHSEIFHLDKNYRELVSLIVTYLMKILFIAYLLTCAAALPRFFKNINLNNFPTTRRRGTGMTSTSIRTYIKQQRHRQRLHAAAQSQIRINNILDTYFKVRDSN